MKVLLLSLSLFFCRVAHSQSFQPDSAVIRFKARNAIYLEVGGTAVVYSVNYDRILSDRKKWKTGGRLGLSFLNPSFNDSRFLAEAYTLKAFKNRRNSYLELGMAFLYRTPRLLIEATQLKDSPASGLSPRIGVRFQKAEGGWLTRIGFTPNFSWQSGDPLKIAPWAGFSIGRSF